MNDESRHDQYLDEVKKIMLKKHARTFIEISLVLGEFTSISAREKIAIYFFEFIDGYLTLWNIIFETFVPLLNFIFTEISGFCEICNDLRLKCKKR